VSDATMNEFVTLLAGLTWKKSSHSGKNGNCVELAWLVDGRVAVRNSRDPHGPALVCDAALLAALVAQLKEANA
jgi:hypothetical protein